MGFDSLSSEAVEPAKPVVIDTNLNMDTHEMLMREKEAHKRMVVKRREQEVLHRCRSAGGPDGDRSNVLRVTEADLNDDTSPSVAGTFSLIGVASDGTRDEAIDQRITQYVSRLWTDLIRKSETVDGAVDEKKVEVRFVEQDVLTLTRIYQCLLNQTNDPSVFDLVGTDQSNPKLDEANRVFSKILEVALKFNTMKNGSVLVVDTPIEPPSLPPILPSKNIVAEIYHDHHAPWKRPNKHERKKLRRAR